MPPSLPHNPNHRNPSPMDSKKHALNEDSKAPSSDTKDQKPDVDSQTSLAPPPRPAVTTATDTPDYFNSVHNPFSLEPNPFEQSFGGGGGNPSETPGKSLLPPVASLTSPALPGASSAGGYNWSNSLRSGPLSPAMLAGPTGPNDYFDSIGRGFPTPNESSLRTGLTPGGGGSMFPAPSPNSQAILQQLQSGGATPSTIEFHRTALNAAKKNGLGGPTSNPTTDPEAVHGVSMDIKGSQPAAVDPFTHHDAADAANGLFMLAKGGQANQFVSNPSSVPSHAVQGADQSHDMDRRGSHNVNGALSSGREMSGDASDMQEQAKPTAKGKAKRNSATKVGTAPNNRRKADDTPAKGANKKAKTNNSAGSVEPPSDPGDSEEEEELKRKIQNDSKKMTDEEKRRNFLERNRVAALKCRQRKKQWLANLQAKVELFTTENDALTATVTQLREEIVNLKTLLLAHKDCPVSQAQGLGPLMMNGMSAGFDPHPYNIPSNMGMQPGAPIPTQGMRR
ncbi:bZIP transcription factor atfA [Aspergillus clavatus NRRL 1]|uniref:Basic leucine zipper (bZIP) transcription factor atfB n=1 Tax=Aspergillus clavatus (strain ATCC 1007 / CBS 513.65 / DSM 816 / NCTC 3887 / NRRL 1 / QM 1276 / 107) TaxID=344612 RepID=A1CKN3_ASPCL|nr:bZIP transcription factor (AtfA), putative [Aspergillus clavatus NRRL 1]EAW09707.1 bZIP transcription factor (AtfA), putative [Aspergillus clavatus NRRL 1]